MARPAIHCFLFFNFVLIFPEKVCKVCTPSEKDWKSMSYELHTFGGPFTPPHDWSTPLQAFSELWAR